MQSLDEYMTECEGENEEKERERKERNKRQRGDEVRQTKGDK